MIYVVLPPRTRPTSCPFVQRTTMMLRVLSQIDETAAKVPFEDETPNACDGDLVFFSWPEPRELPKRGLAIECGVGYDLAPWGPLRVYESEAWRHYSFGKYAEPLDRRRDSWVIPWAFDEEEWPLGDGRGGYVSYLGRLSPDKGIQNLLAVARLMPSVEFRAASTDPPSWLGVEVPRNVVHVGPVTGLGRADFLGKAFAHLCPTDYVEPLGGGAIEAMLSGTPVVASNYGGFTESVKEGVGGFLRADAGEMRDAVISARSLDRSAVRIAAASRYGLEASAARWKPAVERMKKLAEKSTRRRMLAEQAGEREALKKKHAAERESALGEQL